MSQVSISGLTRRFEGSSSTPAVSELDLEVEDGEFLVLLGPSGCGKTTTLRCLAGLERPSEGIIRLGETTVWDREKGIDLPPDKRFIGMVFQSYALWPHMTVRKNIEYPLRARRDKVALKDGSVERTAALVDCENLLDRYPAQLSGGQQQRVALARGLVAEPELVLFDEPLSNLDARLRDQVRAELHELHQRKPFTAVFVTHDQSEALALGTRMAIMRAGRIEQLASPREVFSRPATEYVASFIGMSNRLKATYRDGGWHVGGSPLRGAELKPEKPGSEVVIRLRPDDARLTRPEDALAPGEVGMLATVADVEFGGRHLSVVVEVAEGLRLNVEAELKNQSVFLDALRRGDRVVFAFNTANVRYFGEQDAVDFSTVEAVAA